MGFFYAEPARPDDSKDGKGKTAVLLLNLGTPQAPTAGALRRYLRQFLADRRVVELPRALWLPLLYGVILPLRPARSAQKYASIWTPQGSPLKVHGDQLVAQLRQRFSQPGAGELLIESAMTYGEPSVAQALQRLKSAGARRILILPLYPQYAGSTSGAAFDAVWRELLKTRDLPEIRCLRSYAADPGYIGALAASVRAHWQEQPPPADGYRLLLSFHGIPQRSVDAGDSYAAECTRTSELLARELNLDQGRYVQTYQSRFGRARWLEPSTSASIRRLAAAGVRRIDVICPGFAGDCLETLEEIAIEGQADFIAAGGSVFHYIAALNSRPAWLEALEALIRRQITGWEGWPES